MPTPTQPVAFPPALSGDSAEAVRARHAYEAAAGASTPVLVVAEEGFDTGDIAQRIHEVSRPGAPFVSVDVARVNAADLEAQLFGLRERPGVHGVEVLGANAALLRAGPGTVFVDGLADLPAAAQRRLARVLRDGEARPAGRVRVPLQARFIASALPAIHNDVREGRVRSDLYRRFGGLEVVVPPLRSRPADFATLVPTVAAAVSRRLGRATPVFTQPALTVLAALPWRRNMQELEALIERVLRAVPGEGIKQEDVLAQLSFDGAFARRIPAASLREARLRFERDYIAAVLEHHQWRMSEAARALGMERANLYRKARQLGISRGAPAQGAHR